VPVGDNSNLPRGQASFELTVDGAARISPGGIPSGMANEVYLSAASFERHNRDLQRRLFDARLGLGNPETWR
jgi:hypothetical protein